MSRESVKKAFDEVLPKMGFGVRRDAQYQYAMMVQDKLDMKPETASEENGSGEISHPGSRPVFGAIEAGTGTGKTLGYLIPVLLHIAETGGRARITTHTLALQDQIYGRDALYSDRQPDFSQGDRSDMAIALEVVKRLTDKPLSSGFRKGRQAYVSPMAVMEILFSEKDRTGADAALCLELRKWAQSVQVLQDDLQDSEKDGDQLILKMQNDPMQGLIAGFMDAHDGRLPTGISASDICMLPGSNDNPFHRHHAGTSEDRDILVVSHTLSLFDLQMGGNVLLPPAKVVVHDEADTLAGVAEMYARKKIRPNILRNALRSAYPDVSVAAPVAHLDSLLTEILKWFSHEYDRHNPVDAEGLPLLSQPVSEVMLDDKTVIVTSALGYIRMLREAVNEVMRLNAPTTERALVRFKAKLQQIGKDLTLATGAFPANTEFGSRRLSLDRDGFPKNGRENSHLVLGLTWTQKKKFPAFEVVNLYSSRLFSKEWFFKSTELETVLLTSATMRTTASVKGKSDEWTYMTQLLGMPEGSGRAVSVKKFGTIKRVHLMNGNDHPFSENDRSGELPYNQNWLAGVQAMLVDMLKTGECGLVLTASFRDVEAVKEGFPDQRIWWQTDSKNMHWTDGVEAIRSGRCEVMVTPSVWAGVNIRDAQGGQLIRHLGILRAPIAPPDKIREKALANYLRFKGLDNGADPDVTAKNVMRLMASHAGKHRMTQGLGRGIRSARDEVEVWLMDHRLGHPQWQATFPERFRGVFADPDVLRLVSTHPDLSDEETEQVKSMARKKALLESLKRPPASQKSAS